MEDKEPILALVEGESSSVGHPSTPRSGKPTRKRSNEDNEDCKSSSSAPQIAEHTSPASKQATLQPSKQRHRETWAICVSGIRKKTPTILHVLTQFIVKKACHLQEEELLDCRFDYSSHVVYIEFKSKWSWRAALQMNRTMFGSHCIYITPWQGDVPRAKIPPLGPSEKQEVVNLIAQYEKMEESKGSTQCMTPSPVKKNESNSKMVNAHCLRFCTSVRTRYSCKFGMNCRHAHSCDQLSLPPNYGTFNAANCIYINGIPYRYDGDELVDFLQNRFEVWEGVEGYFCVKACYVRTSRCDAMVVLNTPYQAKLAVNNLNYYPILPNVKLKVSPWHPNGFGAFFRQLRYEREKQELQQLASEDVIQETGSSSPPISRNSRQESGRDQEKEVHSHKEGMNDTDAGHDSGPKHRQVVTYETEMKAQEDVPEAPPREAHSSVERISKQNETEQENPSISCSSVPDQLEKDSNQSRTHADLEASGQTQAQGQRTQFQVSNEDDCKGADKSDKGCSRILDPSHVRDSETSREVEDRNGVQSSIQKISDTVKSTPSTPEQIAKDPGMKTRSPDKGVGKSTTTSTNSKEKQGTSNQAQASTCLLESKCGDNIEDKQTSEATNVSVQRPSHKKDRVSSTQLHSKTEITLRKDLHALEHKHSLLLRELEESRIRIETLRTSKDELLQDFNRCRWDLSDLKESKRRCDDRLCSLEERVDYQCEKLEIAEQEREDLLEERREMMREIRLSRESSAELQAELDQANLTIASFKKHSSQPPRQSYASMDIQSSNELFATSIRLRENLNLCRTKLAAKTTLVEELKQALAESSKVKIKMKPESEEIQSLSAATTSPLPSATPPSPGGGGSGSDSALEDAMEEIHMLKDCLEQMKMNHAMELGFLNRSDSEVESLRQELKAARRRINELEGSS